MLRERGITAEALAVLGDCDTSTAYRIVRGEISRPRAWTTVAIAKALGFSPKRFERMVAAAYDVANPDERVPA